MPQPPDRSPGAGKLERHTGAVESRQVLRGLSGAGSDRAGRVPVPRRTRLVDREGTDRPDPVARLVRPHGRPAPPDHRGGRIGAGDHRDLLAERNPRRADDLLRQPSRPGPRSGTPGSISDTRCRNWRGSPILRPTRAGSSRWFRPSPRGPGQASLGERAGRDPRLTGRHPTPAEGRRGAGFLAGRLGSLLPCRRAFGIGTRRGDRRKLAIDRPCLTERPGGQARPRAPDDLRRRPGNTGDDRPGVRAPLPSPVSAGPALPTTVRRFR